MVIYRAWRRYRGGSPGERPRQRRGIHDQRHRPGPVRASRHRRRGVDPL